jgi:WD40 repeat protein
MCAGQGQLMSKLRGHDKTVVSVSWSPWTEGAAGDTSLMLASGGLDQEIHIWQPKTGLNIKTIQTPVKYELLYFSTMSMLEQEVFAIQLPKIEIFKSNLY